MQTLWFEPLHPIANFFHIFLFLHFLTLALINPPNLSFLTGLASDQSSEVADVENNLGVAEFHLKNYRSSERHHNQALRIRQRITAEKKTLPKTALAAEKSSEESLKVNRNMMSANCVMMWGIGVSETKTIFVAAPRLGAKPRSKYRYSPPCFFLVQFPLTKAFLLKNI